MTTFLDAAEAVGLVADGQTVIVGGSGAGHAVPQAFIDALADRYERERSPRNLTTVRVVGLGDFADRGFSQLAKPGLMRRTIGSNIGNEPRLGELVAAGEIEAYSFPQGVLSQLCREIAAGRPGLVTHVGLGTYVDPRHTGGKQGAAAEDLVEVIELAGREWLFFRAFPIDVAVIRGSVIDDRGNLSMIDEAIRGDMTAMAMAAHNSGGIVIAQAGRRVPAATLPPRQIDIPGALIDYAYLDGDQWQTYQTRHSPFFAGAERVSPEPPEPTPLDVRKVIARRSLLEFRPGDICNLGFGISQSIGRIAWEEGIADELVLTVEQGVFGGIPASGPDGGAGVNYQALLEQPAMFDFYDGGGLDIASLSFAEVDARGNVNVHRFGERLRGPGGFPNISARTERLNFVGTLTADGFGATVAGGRIHIDHEGSSPKFVQSVAEVTFSGDLARSRGQKVRYITERAVFELRTAGVTLVEIAPGFRTDDILAVMGFRPEIADDVTSMDPALFDDAPMGLSARFARERR